MPRLSLAISAADAVEESELIAWFDSTLGGPSRVDYDAASLGFYKILWIGRKDDIAYRKALCIMSRRKWDALGVEVVAVNLG
jgi:hypothetical protein